MEGDKDKYVMFSHMGGNLFVIRSTTWGVPPHGLIRLIWMLVSCLRMAT